MGAALRIEALLFDVDETLFDRRRAQILVVERFPESLPDLFGDVPADRLHEAWDRSDRETENHVATTSDTRASRNVRSALFLRLLDRPEEAADRVTDAYLDIYPTVDAPVDGAAEVVAACAELLPVGVVSNAYPDVQRRKLETLGLRHHFRCIVLSEEYGGPRKPAPEIFLHGCEQLGSDPATTLYVGDSWGNDVIGARTAGLIPCWYNPASTPVPDGHEAPLQLRSLRVLPGLLSGQADRADPSAGGVAPKG